MRITKMAGAFVDARGPDPTDRYQLLGSYTKPMLATLRKLPDQEREDFAQEYWTRVLESQPKHDPSRARPDRKSCAISGFHKNLLGEARDAARRSSAPMPRTKTVRAYLANPDLGRPETQELIRNRKELSFNAETYKELSSFRPDYDTRLDARSLVLRLPERLRKAITRRYLQEGTLDEVAEVIGGVSRERARQLVNEGLEALRKATKGRR